ncbi:MAG: YceI family protein [Bryobacteraceae bacterium]|jgi:polyisoprenoid-binding protein YceI
MASYQIDPQHTGAHFKVRHMMISNVKGEFSGVKGWVEFDPSNTAASHIEATIDAKSIGTREPDRDRHLRSSDFLDVARNPAIEFRSTSITPAGKDSYEVAGDLTIRGVTHNVILRVDSVTPEIKDPSGWWRRGATAKALIDRRDFGLTWNAALESGGFLVGDDVEITIDVEMVRKAE